MKTLQGVYSNPRQHWVGDGFPVRSLFSYNTHGKHLSPFLLLDYAGPAQFEPAARPRGVGTHPHRGFETVTIVYQGEVDHRDSTGAGGHIGPGDVQWMTAGGGILHDEFHSQAFTERGGTLEMVQLWVNLPARDKRVRPGYQTLLNADIPDVALPGGAGRVRVIAGAYAGHQGPARTFTPMDVWDVRLTAGAQTRFDIAAGRTLALVVLHGAVKVNGEAVVRASHFAQLSREGEGVLVEAQEDATVLLLSGEPIDEPIVGYGPFVMNTEAEIVQAMNDFNSGRFGSIAA
ncbi:pirin family protein [Thiomonas bhubaneswarensis]|uniref:Redox-sensitive bicupin YhaK, pirin superfamily n=1 Tax=Thiomonas bhubaneswarensis TaxID=339866 RepID=A0A0K6I5T3_9BURK|nr:pirin family protein [Thiomonas bhubaneswarensis]CUA98418.1 Redox-sensitive bicupin YhaK, pirin superfamily [Thiomonas bhubaneswarensis]